MKSPRYPEMMAFDGKNIAPIAIVAIIIGTKSSLALSVAASSGRLPLRIFSIYPSIVMIESSTIIPSTTIRAARVTMFMGMLSRYIAASEVAVHTGTPVHAIIADLSGKSINITIMTTRMDTSRSLRKFTTERLTTLGWSVMRVIVTLSGVSSENAEITLSTSSPNAVMLLSGRIATERTMEVWPL